MKKNKVIFVHDYFENLGGGEKLILSLVKKKDTLITSFTNKKIKKFLPKIKILSIQKYNSLKILNKLFVIISFYFFKFKKKEKNIFVSGNYSLFLNLDNFRNKIFYCHSLPKLFFRYKDFYYNKNLILNFFNSFFSPIFKFIYLINIKKFDYILTNSNYTKKKLEKYLKKKINIINPPIKNYYKKNIKNKNFFLSNNRHELEKNIDKIIEVFNKLKDKKIIIISEGSLTKKLKMLSKSNNIKFMGIVDEYDYQKLLNECIATINISSKEDFGMSALEGMSAGKPAIVVNQGGYLETCKKNYNSFIINHNNLEKNLYNLIKNFNFRKAKKMSTNCKKTAKLYSSDSFYKKINSLFI